MQPTGAVRGVPEGAEPPAEPIVGWRPLAWLRGYRLRWLPSDLVAGVTLAAYAIPVSLAYAALAGLPPEVGIYGYLLGGLGYALFGSSRHLAVGPTSAISLLVATGVGAIAGGDAPHYAEVASLVAVAVGGICVAAWLVRLSALTSFIGETILLGFKAGAGITIAVTQLPKLFGVKGGGHGFFERVGLLAEQVGGLHPLTLAVGAAALVLLLLGDRLFPGRPAALVVVILSIVVSSYASLEEKGLSVVGAIPSGLPSIGLPRMFPREVDGVIPLAFACFLLGYIEGVSAAKSLALKHRQRVDVRKELLGLGAANLLVALGHGYPVAGGLSQSAVNEKGGAKSPLSLAVASAALALCLLFLTRLVRPLPNAVLAAIVLVAVKGLIKVPEILRLRKLSRLEFAVALVAFAGVLVLGILKGVILAALASLALLIARASSPHVATLGRIPGSRRFSDLERHPDNERVPGALVFRVEAAILYFNAEHVEREMRAAVAAAPEGLRLVVLDLSTTPTVDVAGAGTIVRLMEDWALAGVKTRVVNARASVRDLLRAAGVEERTAARIDRFSEVADAIEAGLD
jgi:high affinity sulfate transporter 1